MAVQEPSEAAAHRSGGVVWIGWVLRGRNAATREGRTTYGASLSRWRELGARTPCSGTMRGMGYVRVPTFRSRWLVAVVLAAMLVGSACAAEPGTAPLGVDLSALGLNNVGIELPEEDWQAHVDLVCQSLATAAAAARALADDVGVEGQLEGFTATINAGVSASCPILGLQLLNATGNEVPSPYRNDRKGDSGECPRKCGVSVACHRDPWSSL